MANYVNLASLQRGTFGTINVDNERHRNDIPLSDNWNVDNHSPAQEDSFYIVNFLGLVTMDTLVVRMFEKDNRTHTFHQFDSFDGTKWTEILKPGSTGKGAFKITFDPRLVSQIRIRGKSTVDKYLHFVRFQAFNISGVVIAPPVSSSLPQSTGAGLLSSDSRDAAWKVISLPGGTSFKAGENAIMMKPCSTWRPYPSTTSGWIGVNFNGEEGVSAGDFQYQTTFTVPANCTTLDVSVGFDNKLRSVVVSDGTKSQTITSFTLYNGNGWEGLSSFTVKDLIPNAVTTMTFTVYNEGGPSGLLVQFGAFK